LVPIVTAILDFLVWGPHRNLRYGRHRVGHRVGVQTQ
jgi:hypothetical protein